MKSLVLNILKAALVAALLPVLMVSSAFARPEFAAIAVDARTGQILFADRADSPRHPASLTKMMTLYVLFQEMKSGRISRDTQLTMSRRCSFMAPTKMNIRAGGQYSVDDAIKSLVVKSANDVACSVAENLGGSESAYAARMTRTARDMGMRRSTFMNASGLPNPGQWTTARDMATLGLRLQRDFPQYYPYFRTTSFMFRGRLVRGHNKLVANYPGTDGIKTGYIANAGFNLVTSTRRGDKRLVGTVLGATSPAVREAYMMRMLENNFASARNGNTIAALPGTSAGAINPISVAVATAKVAAPTPLAPKANSQSLAQVAEAASADSNVQTQMTAGQDDMATLVTSTATAQPIAVDDQAPSGKKPKKPSFKVVSANDQPATMDNAAADSWTIQVGSFPDKNQADEKLAVLRGKLPDLLGSKDSFTTEAKVRGKMVYRARFSGFDAATAKKLCKKLKKECMPMAPEG
ncbi:serine hydrolase [Aestuariivirga litoralis]|uniref:serine hydrolase n=1 Tax=Aestuariivirga litoralis TaxID=2650924 RepID=UPI0018C509CA|nr:serine hydrolase [Aestuariivirga litoralis]MBG1231626.1 D-alanyl-D-alanine carboxypeptidase [Aestuariivirga litoralis]